MLPYHQAFSVSDMAMVCCEPFKKDYADSFEKVMACSTTTPFHEARGAGLRLPRTFRMN